MFQHRRRCQYCTAPGLVGCSASLERCSVHAAAPESRTMSRFRAQGNAPPEEPLLLRIFSSVLNVLLRLTEGRSARTPPFFPSRVESWNPVRGGGSRPCVSDTPFRLCSRPAADLNAAIFTQAVAFPPSSPRQTRLGSAAWDHTNHLSFYFCTWPLLSSAPSTFLPAPGAAPAIGPSAAVAAVSRQLSVN